MQDLANEIVAGKVGVHLGTQPPQVRRRSKGAGDQTGAASAAGLSNLCRRGLRTSVPG